MFVGEWIHKKYPTWQNNDSVHKTKVFEKWNFEYDKSLCLSSMVSTKSNVDNQVMYTNYETSHVM